MVIRHIFMTAMKPETTEGQFDEIIKDLRCLDGKIAGMSGFFVGKNLGWYDKKMQLVLFADFLRKEDWKNYMHNPEHLKIGEKYMHLFDEPSMVVSQTEI